MDCNSCKNCVGGGSVVGGGGSVAGGGASLSAATDDDGVGNGVGCVGGDGCRVDVGGGSVGLDSDRIEGDGVAAACSEVRVPSASTGVQ